VFASYPAWDSNVLTSSSVPPFRNVTSMNIKYEYIIVKRFHVKIITKLDGATEHAQEVRCLALCGKC
jgi:hypothetical protein